MTRLLASEQYELINHTDDHPPEKMSSRDILALLYKRYGKDPSKWLFIPEMRVGTAYEQDSQQQIDLWVMGLWPSNDYARISFEIKVSKTDYKRELEKPNKRRAAMRLSNYYWFVAPVGIIDPQTVPIDCGLMDVMPEGHIRRTIPAPWRDTPMPTWRFFAAFGRRVIDMYPTSEKGD